MDVPSWLQANGFERFVALFEENEIDSDVIGELTDADLAGIGIPLGPRKKLLKAIAQMFGSSKAVPEFEPSSTEPSSPPGNSQTATSQSGAERRQLTVMFADLVGSTALSERLDPEDMRDVITSYQNMVAGLVTRFEGQVAKYMGDGVLCYFGWPRAHEDDAERAVRAGLAIMQALSRLKTPQGDPLSARAGVATGLVVVGDLIGEGAAQEEAVVGETPNLASRIQDLAGHNQVVVAESTRHLLGDTFVLSDLGGHSLKGISGQTVAYAVTSERAVESRFEARSSGAVSAMVGRDQELALMMERWNQAKGGEGQFVLLTGEAGIGKSRITRAMIDAVAGEAHIRVSYQCSPYHSDSSLYPAIQQLTFAAGIKPGDSNDEKLDKLEAVAANQEPAINAALLGLPAEQRYGPLGLTPPQQRARTLQALVNQLLTLAQDDPVLFLLEDAHWIDASTLELLDLCLEQITGARVLMLVTARPTFEYSFGGHPIVTKLALNRLGRDQVTAIVDKITGGKPLPDELLDEIVAKTDGVPLFIEELTKTVLESGDLKETPGAYELVGPLSHLAIPATLHDSLMARLDRLQPVKEVAQTAACIGREFSQALLSVISPLDEIALQDALKKLIAAELIFRRGAAEDASYIFKHALVRDAAYGSLLRTRRQAIHTKLVDALEAQEQSAPELLAYHCEHCGQLEKAMAYWRAAGNAALARPAYTEAIGHFTAASALIGQLEDPLPWREFELELQLQLAQVHLTRNGYGSAEAAKAYAAANALLREVDRPDLLVPATYGLWIGHYMRGAHKLAYPLVESLVAEVAGRDDAVAKLVSNRMFAATLIALGEQSRARKHLEFALELYQPDLMTRFAEHFAQEPGVQIRSYLLMNLFFLGYPDQARMHQELSQVAATKLNHVNTTCYGALHWAVLGFMNRDDQLARSANDTMLELGQQHSLHTWQTFGAFGEALFQSRAGDATALDRLAIAFDAYTARGEWLFLPFYKTEQARELLRHGHTDAALSVCQATLDIIDEIHECWYLPELLRLEGEIHLATEQSDLAEASFQRALDAAREQSAKSFELRAATKLAALWFEQGTADKARDLLRPIFDWFTEGFDTPDLKDAKTLLDQLG